MVLPYLLITRVIITPYLFSLSIFILNFTRILMQIYVLFKSIILNEDKLYFDTSKALITRL